MKRILSFICIVSLLLVSCQQTGTDISQNEAASETSATPAATATPTSSAAEIVDNTYTYDYDSSIYDIYTAEDFLNALGSDRTLRVHKDITIASRLMFEGYKNLKIEGAAGDKEKVKIIMPEPVELGIHMVACNDVEFYNIAFICGTGSATLKEPVASSIYIQDCSDIKLDNMAIICGNESAVTILFSDLCKNMTISNCELIGSNESGIKISGCKNMEIRNSIIRDCKKDAVYLDESEVSLKNVQFINAGIENFTRLIALRTNDGIFKYYWGSKDIGIELEIQKPSDWPPGIVMENVVAINIDNNLERYKETIGASSIIISKGKLTIETGQLIKDYDKLSTLLNNIREFFNDHAYPDISKAEIIFSNLRIDLFYWVNWLRRGDNSFDITITDDSAEIPDAFWLKHGINSTPSESIKSVYRVLGMPDAGPTGDFPVSIRFAGVKFLPSDLFYQYEVKRIRRSGSYTQVYPLFTLNVQPETGLVADNDYKNLEYVIYPLDPEVRQCLLDHPELADGFVISSDSVMTVLENYKYEKIIKAEGIKHGEPPGSKLFILRVKSADGRWVVAEESIVAFEEYKNDPYMKHTRFGVSQDIIRNNLGPAETFEYSQLSDDEKDLVAAIDETLRKGHMYIVDISPSGQIKYDFNSDGVYETLSYDYFRAESISSGYYGSAGYYEFEIRLGSGGAYHLGYYDGVESLVICDIDKSDGCVNFFVQERDHVYSYSTVYRLNGTGLELVVSMPQIMAVSGDGKIYYWGGNLFETYNEDFDPNAVLSYYDIKLGDYAGTDQIIGKVFTNFGYKVIYESKEYAPWGPPVEENLSLPGAIRYVREGEKIKILEVDGNVAKIEAEDGLIGWLGSFHMVWD